MRKNDALIIKLSRGDSRTKKPYGVTCVVNGRPYLTTGSCYGGDGVLYRLLTLLAYEGHEGRPFQVWDDRSPLDGPGGLAMTGRVRSYLRDDLIRDGLFGRLCQGTRVMPANEARKEAA